LEINYFMYYCDARLQYPVRVEKPNPLFAKMLQQAIGGVEGEMRVCLQYFFQAWGSRGPKKYRDMLLQTATEEIGHIEMLATAVALNLEGAPVSLQEAAAKDGAVSAVLGGMNPRHFLSAGLAATPENANGVPFNCSHVYASGNIAGDMLANATAEATGRTLACRLYEMTDDPGMKDMLSFLIARDTMHQQQWLAVLEELGGYKEQLPVPNSFPQSQEKQEWSYVFLNSNVDGHIDLSGRFTQGPSLDGKGTYSIMQNKPLGEEPLLATGPKEAHAQSEQTASHLGKMKAEPVLS
jgi:Mn-containing catalase